MSRVGHKTIVMHLEFLYLRVISRMSNYAPRNPEGSVRESRPRRGNLATIYYQYNIYKTASPAAPNATPQNAPPRATRDAAPVNCGTPVAEVTVPLLNAPVPEELSGTVVLGTPGAESVSVSRPPEGGAAE